MMVGFAAAAAEGEKEDTRSMFFLIGTLLVPPSCDFDNIDEEEEEADEEIEGEAEGTITAFEMGLVADEVEMQGARSAGAMRIFTGCRHALRSRCN